MLGGRQHDRGRGDLTMFAMESDMPLVRALVLSAVLLLANGCSSWHTVPLRPEAAPVIDASHPVRVFRANGTFVVLWSPQVVGDSIIGDVGNPPLRSAVALRDVQRLQVLGASAARTAGAVGVGIGMTAVIVGLGFLGLVALMFGM